MTDQPQMTRFVKGRIGSGPRSTVPARRTLHVKLTDEEIARYRAERTAAGDKDLSSMVRRLVEQAIKERDRHERLEQLLDSELAEEPDQVGPCHPARDQRDKAAP